MSQEYPGQQPQGAQQPQPGQWQQPQWQPQPPPKKKHTVRNVFLIITALVFLGVAGCIAIVVSIGNEVGKDAVDRAEPRTVTVGQAFDLGKHQTLAGWTVKNDAGMFNVTGTGGQP